MNPKTDFALLYQTDQSKINWIMVIISKEPKISLPKVDSLIPLSDLGIICLVKKQNPFSDSFGFKNPILDFITEMHP